MSSSPRMTESAGGAALVDAPGPTGDTYSYTIPTGKPILIDCGERNDRVIITGTLGSTVTIRGGQGKDSLLIDTLGLTATYTPAASQTTGMDGQPDYRGTFKYGTTTTINFQEFETTSEVQANFMNGLTLVTPNAADSIDFTNITGAGGEGFVSGTSGGTAFVPLRFNRAGTFTLDARTNNGASATDTIAAKPGTINLTTAVMIKTGDGNDTLTYNGTSAVTPVTFDSAGGNDSLTISNANAVGPFFNSGTGANSATLASGAWTVASDLGANGHNGRCLAQRRDVEPPRHSAPS